jgi:hypothetical protein
MNLSMRLTLDSLVGALRWKGLQAADLHQTRDQMAPGSEPDAMAPVRVKDKAAKERMP